MLPELLVLAWTFVARDVAWNLQGACRRVYFDATDRKTRRRRARGLRLLGKAMLAAHDKNCVDNSASAEDINRRLNRAYNLAVMKR